MTLLCQNESTSGGKVVEEALLIASSRMWTYVASPADTGGKTGQASTCNRGKGIEYQLAWDTSSLATNEKNNMSQYYRANDIVLLRRSPVRT